MNTTKENDYIQFSKYQTKECFTDVTLVSDDLWKFAAHRIILSAASPVLESLLMSSMSNMNDCHTILPLRGYNRYDVQGLLNIIYSKTSANDISLDLGIKRLLKDLKVKDSNNKTESPPTSEKELKSFPRVRREFEILNKSNIAIEAIKSQKSDIIDIKGPLMIENEETETLNIYNESLTLESVVPKDNLNDESNYKDDQSTIILEGQECSIVNDDEDNSETEIDDLIDGAVNKLKNGNDEMITIIPGTKLTFDCALCDSTYNRNALLLRHEKSHKSDKFICKTCKKEFKNLNRVKIHYDSLHKEARYKCKKCDYKSGKKLVIRSHVRYHLDATFGCDMCDKSFKVKHKLTYHKQTHMQDHERRIFECDTCHQFYPSKATLHGHKKLVHDLVRYPCSMCPFKASSKNYLRKHEEGSHQGITYDCSLCNYKGKFETSLKKHIQVEHNGLRFYCDECTEQYRSQRQLKKHKVAKHGQEKSKRSHNRAMYSLP